MNRVNRRFVLGEYEDFSAHVKADWAVPGSVLDVHEATIKGVFRRYLGLSCLSSVLAEGSLRNAYVVAIPEAACLAIILSLRNCVSTSCVLLRQIIELSLRHIYFETHPVEYAWAQNRDGYRDMGFPALMDYLRATDEVADLRNSERTLEVISDWYARLSRFTHLHNVGYMGFPGINLPQKGDVEISILKSAAETLWPQLMLLLVIFRSDNFLKSSEAEQKLVRDALGTPIRRSLSSFLRERQ